MKCNRRSFLTTAGALAAMPAAAAARQAGSKPQAKRATYVLVHGGGHGGWCFQRVAKPLRAAGHDVYTPTLTGLGERKHLVSPDTDLDTHITDVVNMLDYEDLTNVILLGHSYGGRVITGVADRATKRIGHLVFLDAGNPQNGDTLVGVASIQDARSRGRTVNGVELILWPDREIISKYLGVTKAEDVAWLMDKITPHPYKCFAQPLRLSNEAAMRKIPRTDINRPSSTSTAGPPDKSSRPPTAVRRAAGKWEINTGHDMMITAPDAVTEILLTLA